jgi:hypothetical protein
MENMPQTPHVKKYINLNHLLLTCYDGEFCRAVWSEKYHPYRLTIAIDKGMVVGGLGMKDDRPNYQMKVTLPFCVVHEVTHCLQPNRQILCRWWKVEYFSGLSFFEANHFVGFSEPANPRIVIESGQRNPILLPPFSCRSFTAPHDPGYYKRIEGRPS